MTEWFLFKIEWTFTAVTLTVALLLAWRRFAVGDKSLSYIRLANNRPLAIVIAALFPVALRLALLPVLPAPNPSIMEEFGYLLQADTFLHGRLTNPAAPLPYQLETFQQLMTPTYASFRPPGQGLFLALGQLVFGHPWAGVCLTVAGFGAALCWMLQAWLPLGWAFGGALMGGIWLAEFGYWMNSYWGGALAAMGGCLVLGAYPRIKDHQSRTATLLFCGGLAILSTTRAYEGLFVILPVSFSLLVWCVGDPSVAWRRKFLHVVFPIAIGSGLIIAFNLYYDWRLVGDPFVTPYQIGRKLYSMAPVFVFQQPQQGYHYNHLVMQKFYNWDLENYWTMRTIGGYIGLGVYKIYEFWRLYVRPELTLPLLLIPRVIRRPNLRLPASILGLTMIGLSIENWAPPYYYAPTAGVLILLMLEAMRSTAAWKVAGKPAGVVLSLAPLASCALTAALAVALMLSRVQVTKQLDFLWYGLDHRQDERAEISRKLEALPGKHVVLVKYGTPHFTELYHWEWVFNRADIEGSKVVWARETDPEKDREVVEHFAGRNVWLVEPDVKPVRLQPIESSQLSKLLAAHGR